MTTTDQHDVIEAINALNESGKKAFAWDKLGAYLKQNGGIYYSGLFFAYAKPGEKLGKTLEQDGYTFEVPKMFQGLDLSAVKSLKGPDSEHMLIISHEHLEVDADTKTVRLKSGHENRVRVEPFSRENGWYGTKDWDFPNGEASKREDPKALRWWVRSGHNFGLLVRCDSYFVDLRCVGANYYPGYRFGVLVE